MSKYKGAPVLVIDTVKSQSVPILTFNNEDYNSAEFIIQVKKNGETLPLTDTTARLYFHKPDKTTVFYDYPVTDAEAGEITVTLTTNTLAAPGMVTCELFLYDVNGDEIAVARKFKYIVERSLVNDEAVESSNEYQSLNRIIVDGEVAVETANTSAANADIAATNANDATSNATAATEGANTATTAANTAASTANAAATNANTAATAANNAKTAADTATANANTATTNANNAATSANNAAASITSFTNEVTNARTAKDGTVFPNVKAHTDSIHDQIGILNKKTGLSKNIMEYAGMVNDGSINVANIVQIAENEVSQLATSLGVTITLFFPDGLYRFDTTVNKKSNVNWVGNGTIQRNTANTTTLYALILADAQSNFVIDGLKFKNMPHHTAYNISSSWSKDVRNCCIHAFESTNFTIKNCNFSDYSEGIVRTGCKDYKIINNYLSSNVQGKSTSQFLDDTYVNIAGNQTGDICGWVLQADTPKYEEGFLIQGNHCLSVGLRIGIECLTQSSNKTQGIITDNIVRGLHQGIKVYKGTYGTLSDAVAHARQTIIKGNQVSYCRENAIYIRANMGVLCTHNFVSNCGMHDTEGGTAYGGILTRISPSVVSTTLAMESGNLISDNYVLNCGKSTGTPTMPIGIQVRTPNTSVTNNRIVQESTYTNKTGYGIYCGSSDDMENATIKGNTVTNFNQGIYISNGAWKDTNLMITLESNKITTCNRGIECEAKYKNVELKSNTIIGATEWGLSVRNTVNNYILSNVFKDCTKGIEIKLGTFSEAFNGGTGRTIPTNIVRGNTFTNCTTPHSIVETAVGDTSFAGRCLHWSNDVVDGLTTPPNIPSGTTANRPVTRLNVGDPYFDTTLGKRVEVKTTGIREVASLTISAGCTTNGNVTITLDGVATTVALTTSDNTSDLVATKIRGTIFSDWMVGGTGSTITFTSYKVGNKTDANYADGGTGATGTMTTSTQGTSHVWVDSTGTTV